jgi:hypothetical protein
MAKSRRGRKGRRAEAERSAANTPVPSWISANLTEFLTKQRHGAKRPANDPPLPLAEFVPSPSHSMWSIFEAALSAPVDKRFFALRILLGLPPRLPGDPRDAPKIIGLPEPYRTAACLLPDNGWVFVRIACLYAVSQDMTRAPSLRELARKELENELARLSQRRRGRPALGLTLPILVSLRDAHGRLKQFIKELRRRKCSPTEQHAFVLAQLRSAVGAHVLLPMPVFEQARKNTSRRRAPHEDAPPAATALRLLAHAVGCSPNVLKNLIFRAHITKEHIPPEITDL